METVMNLISLLGIVSVMLYSVVYGYQAAVKFFNRADLRMTVREVLLPKKIEARGFYIKSILWLAGSVLFINFSGLEGWIVYIGVALNVVAAVFIFQFSIFLGIMLHIFVMMLHIMLKDGLKSLADTLGLLSDILKKLR